MRCTPLIILLGLLSLYSCRASNHTRSERVLTAADQVEVWLPLVKGKKIALVANQTSMVGHIHLVDTMQALGVNVQCVFAPEHGFRGEAEAGEHVDGGLDKQTGVKMVSLYGNHLKPTVEDLRGIDLVIFDIQDVGARFYTYISTLQYVMEACATTGVPLVVFDRPNPNAAIVDGPVLDTAYCSFVGMQPVPVQYAMTIGEYALLLNGEKWLSGGVQCSLSVVKLQQWTHHDEYILPVKPSPNLASPLAVSLYPSLCFFEGTVVSVGRGTDHAFEQFGYPGYPGGTTTFQPENLLNSKTPPMYAGKSCSGVRLTGKDVTHRVEVKWLVEAYRNSADKKSFFTPFILKIAGTDLLKKQIEDGLSADEIRRTWEPGLERFKALRKKYLLYAD